MNEHLKRAFEKVIADYQDYMATVASWESRAKNMTPVEIVEAFKKECDLLRRAKIAERFLRYTAEA